MYKGLEVKTLNKAKINKMITNLDLDLLLIIKFKEVIKIKNILHIIKISQLLDLNNPIKNPKVKIKTIYFLEGEADHKKT